MSGRELHHHLPHLKAIERHERDRAVMRAHAPGRPELGPASSTLSVPSAMPSRAGPARYQREGLFLSRWSDDRHLRARADEITAERIHEQSAALVGVEVVGIRRRPPRQSGLHPRECSRHRRRALSAAHCVEGEQSCEHFVFKLSRPVEPCFQFLTFVGLLLDEFGRRTVGKIVPAIGAQDSPISMEFAQAGQYQVRLLTRMETIIGFGESSLRSAIN